MYPFQPPGFARPPEYAGFPPPPGMVPPPGMAAPGTAPIVPPQATTPQPGMPGAFPAAFQPPPNMPNINFLAPVIRLGTTGPKSAASDSHARTTDRAKAGLGSSLDQRPTARDVLLHPPTKEEILRTIFVCGITAGVTDDDIERILMTAGNLRRWIRATDADDKACKFGFAEYEDPESLSTAVEVLKDVEVPVKRQSPSRNEEEKKDVEKSKLSFVVDDDSLSYLEQYEASTNRDPRDIQIKLDNAKSSLSKVLIEIESPEKAASRSESTVDRDGDVQMTDVSQNGDDTEVVTIPITVDDELSDIPADMRATVAKEIAAFRDRSTRRDLERVRREEELENMEKSRNGPRYNRLASPSSAVPSGPAGGANNVPLGPRNVPAAAKGTGVQIPRDYQKGVSFVSPNSVSAIIGDDQDTDASDEELERRRVAKKTEEIDKHFLDQERRWLNRERSRTAAVEREKRRDSEEAARLEKAKQTMARQLKEWNDDVEASRKVEDYYADRGAWLRARSAFRSQEAAADDADRAAEERELAKSQQQREQARGMADDFLARQAEELESRTKAPREPQRFKLSLGAAAQRAQQAQPTRRTAAEVEGLLEDEEETQNAIKRPLTSIKFDTIDQTSVLTEEERAQAVRQLAADIPADKEGLWNWEVKWDYVDEPVLSEQIKPFVERKIVEYLGVQEQMLVDVVDEHVRKRGSPQGLVEQLEEALDEEAEVLVKKLWRMIIFFSESEKRGLSA